MRPIECSVLKQMLKVPARRLLKELEQALVPRRCVFCGTLVVSETGYVCPPCYDDLPWIKYGCATCAVPIPGDPGDRGQCADCQSDPPPIDMTIAPLEYAFPIDASIKAFKFHRKLHYVPAFANILINVATRLPPDVDAILPVPLHRWRQMRRGFNQATELALPVQKKLQVPLVTEVFRKTATPFQSGLNAEARAGNLRRAFRIRRKLRVRHVLIVDDVITTGATCQCIATLLRDAGVSKVSVLALARASKQA
jgi:ComF family protein